MPTPPTEVSEALKDPRWATARDCEIVDYVLAAGTVGAAERAAGVSQGLFARAIRNLKIRAAKRGYAPGHWDAGVAPGFTMGKVTIERLNPDGTRRWERQHPELESLLAKLAEAVEAAKEEIPSARAVRPPKHVREDLCTQYTITDYHIGELSHAREGDHLGADWNLEIAEEMLVQAIESLAAKSPDSGTCILALLGDLFHFDGPDPVTPTNRHPLTAAGSQRSMVRVVVRAIRRVIQHLLTKHRVVKVVVVEGNHDMAATPLLQEILLAAYENEPRVEVSDNDLPFHALQFGVNFIGFNHGHKKAKESMPILFAAMFRKLWGATLKGYIHCGHYHHADEKEHPGCKVIQHNTLSAPGSHGLRGGWLSEREMMAIYYHASFGAVGRDIVTPEMLAA